MSPPPPEYVQHAGHTPRLSDLPAGHGQDTPTRFGTKHNESIFHNYDHDDDPPLKGPLILPTNPNEGGNSILSTLGSKLQEVAEDPGHATPAVLAHTLPIDFAQAAARQQKAEGDEQGDSKRHLSDPGITIVPTETLGDAGPRLKVKRSMNFGAPLGSLGGFR